MNYDYKDKLCTTYGFAPSSWKICKNYAQRSSRVETTCVQSLVWSFLKTKADAGGTFLAREAALRLAT